MSETDIGMSELPDGWMWTMLEDCTEILDSQRVPINAKERETRIHGKSRAELYPYYGATGQVGWIDDYLFNDELVLLGEDGAPFLDFSKDKAYLIKGKSWVNNHAHVLRARTKLMSNQLLCHYLNIYDYHNSVTGTTRLKLNQSMMRRISIPLPPLPEQHRIVSKIEELFTKLDAGINELHKAQSQLKRYRQSVLKAAFEGKLTEAWRAEHQEEIESTTPIASDLPDGWRWTTLEEVSELNPRIDKQSIDDGLEVTFLPMKNVEELSGKIDLSEIKRFSELKRKNYTPFRDGDILFAKVTPCMENGKIAIAHDLTNGIGFGSTEFHVIRLPEGQSKQFFFFYFLQQKFRQEAKRAMTGAVGLLRVPTDYMRKVPIPLPPLPEQQAIVSEVESRLSVADEVEKTVTAELKRAEQLRQSILKKAFTGKLVPQDPNDEPASALLERIKTQKEIVF